MTDINLDWNKIVQDNKKAGFREGLSAGKDKNFQEYFDAGYKDGFKNGFLMGRFKGALKVRTLMKKEIVEEESLKNTRKALCVMCKDKSLLEGCIEEITSNQNRQSDEFIKCLQKKYNLNVDY
nr:uncharacterized protein LOC111424609 [Onthophagus taurus]